MALELTSLVFKTETSDLERASKVIGELVTNVGKLDKAARDAAQTEVVLAKAAKLNADANLQNAKAQDTRLKSTIAADKADQQATAVIEKKTKATEKVNEVVNKNVGVLQRQKDILEFQTQGFSKGQSSILAYAKAAGLAAEDIGELGKVLETQRKLMGGDPFDKSLSGLKSLQNQYTELKESVRQYATDSNLTAKQARELARDKERLIEKMKVEGASFSEIRQAVRAHNAEYVNLATSYNKMTSAEDAVIKSRKEAVNATNYLTQADQKMAAALNTSNAALDKAGTDSLVKYETALRKSGVSQDVATLKLAKYKAQLEQVQIQEQKRREQHLTRALAPQATDVVVSLWSGQNPLTVLLQQGGQITDLFMQSGVAAEKFGEVVKSSMQSMLPSIRAVVKGVGGLLVDGFVAAGNATKDFIAGIFGMTGAMDKWYMKMSENGPSEFGGRIRTTSSIMTGVFAVGIAVVVAGLVALGVAFKNAIKEGAELNRNLELTGASLGLTKSSALELAQSLASSERPVANVVNVINELAKAGKFSSENIALVTNAAIDLERYGKVSIAETAKELSKLREDPVKALLEVAEKTGYVNLETIATIKSLREQGRMADAAELAMKAWATSSTSAATSIKNQMSPLEQVWDGILSKINQVIGKLQDVARGSGTAEQIADKEAQLASIRGGFFTSTFGLSPKGAKDVERLKEEIYMLKLQLQAETDITEERAKRSSAAAQLRAEAEATRDYTTALEKQASKELTLSAFVKKAVEERTKLVADALGKNVEDVKLSAEAISKITSGAELQWQEMQKKTKSSPSENYYATLMREATNNTIAANTAAQELTKSEQKLLEVRSDPRFEKLTATQKQDVISKYEAAIAAEKQTALTEKLAEAEEHRLKLLGKSEGIGKQYYSDMQKLEEFAKVAGWSREEIEELTRAVFMATPAWKSYEKALEEVNSAARKFNEDSIASQAATLKENESLDYRLSLLGKTAEEQRALSIEYNRANKISEVRIKLAKQLRDIEADIEKAKKAGLPEEDYKNLIDAQVQARKDAAEQEKVINREVAVQYREDFQREFIDPIRNGLTDSIVTALFEGGKAGSKKLREVLVNTLRKKVTIVVDAVVNTLVGNVVGGLFGAGGGSAGGGGGSILGTISNGFSALTGGLSSSISNSFASFAMSSTGQSLGLSSVAADGMGPPALTNMGSNLGTAAGMLGSGLAGYGISSAISGGYTTGGNTVNALAGIASAFFGPIAGVVGGLINRAFGRKLKDTGIQGTFGGQAGFEGEGYKFYKGGWFRSDKTKTFALDSGLQKMLADSFKAMQVQVGTFATVLGLSTEKIAGFTTSMKVSLHGLKEEEIQGKIEEALATANNELAEQVLGTWTKTTRQITEQIGGLSNSGEGTYETVTRTIEESTYAASEYAKEGEKAIDTLSRLAGSLSSVNTVFDTLGYTLYDASLVGGDMASKLVDLFGNLETFTASASSYYQNFYSAEEQRANVQKQLAKSFKELGLSMIDIDATDARQQFRDLVEAQDLTTESGRKAYAALLAIAGTFASVTTEVTGSIMTVADALNALRNETRSVEDIAQNILSLEQALFEAQNSGNIEVLRNNILKGLTEQERVLQRQLWAIEDTRTAQEKLVSAYKGQVTALDSSINRLRTYSDSLKKFKDSLTLGELSPLTPSEQYAEAKRQYESNLALAMVGDVGAQNALQGSITAFLQASRTYNASSSQYTSDFNAAQAGLDFIASITQDQANNEQILRDAAVSQLELLGSIDESVTAVGELISSGLIELSNAILTGLSLGITPDQGVLDAVNNGLGGGQSSYYNSLHNTTQSQSNQPIAIIPVNQASAMQSNSQGLVSLNSQLVEEVRNLTAQVILLRSERQQDTRSQTQILATATTEAGTAITEAINKSNYIQQVVTGVKLN